MHVAELECNRPSAPIQRAVAVRYEHEARFNTPTRDDWWFACSGRARVLTR